MEIINKKEQTLLNQLQRAKIKADKLTVAQQKAVTERDMYQLQVDEMRANKAIQTAKTIANPPKPKKTSDIPVKKLNLAVLGEKLARGWKLHYSDLTIPMINADELSSNSQQLLAYIKVANKLVIDKKMNTVRLQLANRKIDQLLSELRSSLKPFYNREKLAGAYQSYGLKRNQSGLYALLSNNLSRQRQLIILINKLQLADNPLRNLPNFSVQAWLDVQQEHKLLWAESETLRQDRSAAVSAVDVLLPTVENQIKRLRGYFKFKYPAHEVKSRLRVLGFLKESL